MREEGGEGVWQRKPVGWQPPPAPPPPAAPAGWQLDGVAALAGGKMLPPPAESIWAPRALRSDSGGFYETVGVQRRAARRDFDRAVAERRLGAYIVSRGAEGAVNGGGNGYGDGDGDGGGGSGDGSGDGGGGGAGGRTPKKREPVTV